MGQTLKRTGKVLGIFLFVVGLVRSLGSVILALFDKFQSVKELLEYLEKFPEFTKSIWFGPVICLAGVAILTVPMWIGTVRKALGEEAEKQDKDLPGPRRPDLHVDIEEAQVFIQNEFINKEKQTWLLGPELLVRLHVVNKSTVPTTIREIHAIFSSQAKTFHISPNIDVSPISSQVIVAFKPQQKPLENLWSRIDGVALDQGSGKSGWLRFTLEPTQTSRVYFDNGRLEVKIVDSFSNEYLQSVEVPYRKSTDLVIMVDGKAQRPQMTAAEI